MLGRTAGQMSSTPRRLTLALTLPVGTLGGGHPCWPTTLRRRHHSRLHWNGSSHPPIRQSLRCTRQIGEKHDDGARLGPIG
jgi:hypothetical protein